MGILAPILYHAMIRAVCFGIFMLQAEGVATGFIRVGGPIRDTNLFATNIKPLSQQLQCTA